MSRDRDGPPRREAAAETDADPTLPVVDPPAPADRGASTEAATPTDRGADGSTDLDADGSTDPSASGSSASGESTDLAGSTTAGESPAPDGSVAGVLLAAGTSSRFGEANKLLAELDGEPVVRRAARPLVEAGLAPRIAVVGHEADRVEGALAGLGFTAVHNPSFREGQGTSVRAGAGALDEDVAAAVFALGDTPLVDAGTVAALVAAYRDGAGSALAAACDGERGTPVLFDARHFGALADLDGDVGGRAVLLDAPDAALVETGDPGVRRDVDVPADLEAAREE